MGKKIRDEDLVLNIIVNGDRGKKEMGQLERSIRDTRKELEYLEAEEKKLRVEGKKNTDQYRATTAAIQKKNVAIDQAKARIEQLRRGMKLEEMSVKDLKREMIELRKRALDPLNKNYKKHAAQLNIVKARYDELNARAKATQVTLRGLSSGFSRALGSMTAGIASFMAAAFGIQRATDKFVGFDDKIADVQKTTGLAREEVLELNEVLKDIEQFDTRTGQEGMLGLLRIAGKLGIEGRDNLLGFAKASDQIGVALTEDLGGDIEQSINTVGKLVGIFNVSDEFGIEQGLLKVGSTINELGASSEANEGYIVDFTKRLAGVAPSAKISIANIMGMGAALDVAGQSVEVSGTAVSQIITKMFEDTASFARVAGMEVEDFKDLLEKDANQAFITLLRGVKGNEESMALMVERLGDLGIDGVRATNVVSVLANQVDNLEKQQRLSNEAFEEGNSITDEFNIKNTNAAAQLDKSKKAVYNMWVELGERLYPVMIEANYAFSDFLKIIRVFIDFISSNWRIIATATAGIVAYTIAVNATTIATKAAAIAQTLWNKALKANPLALVIGLVTAAATAIYLYTTRTKEAASAQQALNDVQETANKSVSEEKTRIEQLLRVARNKELSDKSRREAVKKLNEISPEYLGNLTQEKINTDEAKKATDAYVQSLVEQAKAQAILNKISELEAKRLEMKRTNKAQSWWEMFTGGASLKPLTDITLQIKALEKELDGLLNKGVKLDDIVTPVTTNTGGNNYISDEQQKEAEERAKYRRDVLESQRSLIEAENAAYEERLKNAGIFNKKFEDMTLEDHQIEYALLKQHQANISKIEADAITAEIERRESAFEKQLNGIRIQQNEELKIFKGTQEERERLLEQHHQQEERLTQEYAANLVSILQTVLAEGDWEGITSDDILSDEEKAAIEKKIEELKLKLSELGLSTGKGEKDNSLRQDGGKDLGIGGNTDILGFTKEDWEDFFDNIENGKLSIQELQFAVSALSDVWRAQNEYRKNAEDQRLQQYESNINRQKDALQARLDQGRISQKEYNKALQKLDADLDKKKAEYAFNQAKRDRNVALMSAIVNTAAAVAQALPNIALSIIAGTMGSLQVGTIAATPLPEIPGREEGGFFDVRRSQDRKFFRAKKDSNKRGYVDGPTVLVGENGREFVASNAAYNNPTIRPVLDVIDTAQRNGSISSVNLERVFRDRPAVSMAGREGGGYIANSNVDAPNSKGKYEDTPLWWGMVIRNAQAINALNETIKKGIKAEVSLLGKGGFVEAQEDYDNMQNDVNL